MTFKTFMTKEFMLCMSANIYSIILKLFGQITLHEDILVQYNFNPLIPSGLDKESLLIQTLPK